MHSARKNGSMIEVGPCSDRARGFSASAPAIQFQLRSVYFRDRRENQSCYADWAIGKAIRPMNTPKRPKAYNSPSSAKKTYRVKSLVRLPIRCGRNKLSTGWTLANPQARRMRPLIRPLSTLEVQLVLAEFSPRSHCAVSNVHFRTRSRVDYRVAMPCLLAFYQPRVLVPDRRRVEDTVKEAIQ